MLLVTVSLSHINLVTKVYFCEFLNPKKQFLSKLTPKMDSLTQIPSKNIYFYMHLINLINSLIITAFTKFKKIILVNPHNKTFIKHCNFLTSNMMYLVYIFGKKISRIIQFFVSNFTKNTTCV